MPDFVLCWKPSACFSLQEKAFFSLVLNQQFIKCWPTSGTEGISLLSLSTFGERWGGGQRRESCITFTPYLNFFNYSLPSCKWVCKLCVRIAYHHEMMLWLCSWWAGDSATSLNYYLDFSTALNPVPYYSLIRVWQLAVISVTPFISCCSLASYIYLS